MRLVVWPRAMKLACAFLALLLSTAACGGAGPMNAAAKAEAAPLAAPAPPPPSVVAGAPGQPASPALLAMNDVGQAKSVPDSPHSATMLIYTANITMAVYQVAAA